MLSQGSLAIHDAFWRMQRRHGEVTSYLRVAAAGLPAAMSVIADDSHKFVRDFLTNPKYKHIFVDVEALKATGFEALIKQQLTDVALTHADQLLRATVIVFDHSALDALLFQFCRATDVLSSEDWDPLIEKRTLTYVELISSEKSAIRKRLIDAVMDQLERESILKKADRLHQICKPQGGRAQPSEFVLSRDVLKRFDDLRHDIVHREFVDLAHIDIWGEHAYVSEVAVYFYGLLAERFDIRVDAEVLQRVMTHAQSPSGIPPSQVSSGS